MTNATELREMEARDEAAAIRRLIVILSARADRLDPTPLRTADTTRAKSCTCNVCGDQVQGIRWTGDPCESVIVDGPGIAPRNCPGRYHLDPEPCTCGDEQIRTTDGRVLGVTLGQLAASQAAIDEAAERWMGEDHDPAEWPAFDGLATTFGGRVR